MKKMEAVQPTPEDGLGWFAVHTNSRAEWLANIGLREQGYETLYLHYLDTVRHARKVFAVNKPYFPRYLFAQVGPDKSIYAINKTQGVSTVVYCGDRPLQVPTDVIQELKSRGDSNGLVKLAQEEKQARLRYKQGDTVKLHAGAFEGLLATVVLDTGKAVRVWLEMFKGRVDVEISPDDVSPVRRRMVQ